MDEKKRRVSITSNIFNKEIAKVIVIAEQEIQQLTNDFGKAYESEWHKPVRSVELFGVYDNFLLRVVEGLLKIRTSKRFKELEDKKPGHEK